MAQTKAQEEESRVRIRAKAGFGPDGHPEVDDLIEQARLHGCRFYDQFTKFIHDRLDIKRN